MIEFKINNDIANVILKGSGGSITTRNVATSDLIALFANQQKSTDIIVPPGVRQIIEYNSQVAYLFMTPGYCGKMPLRWENHDKQCYGQFDQYIDETFGDKNEDYDPENIRVFPVPFPATAVLVSFIKSSKPGELKFKNMWAWALRDTITPYNQQVAYRWPFTNVFGHHRVCIGDVPSTIHNVEAAAAYVRYLYNGLGNHDLDSNASYSKKDHGLGIITAPYQMITKIIDAPEFPVAYLNPVGDLKSVVHTAIFGG